MMSKIKRFWNNAKVKSVGYFIFAWFFISIGVAFIRADVETSTMFFTYMFKILTTTVGVVSTGIGWLFLISEDIEINN